MNQKFPIVFTAILLTLSLFLLTLWRFGATQCAILALLSVLIYRPFRQILFSKAYSMQPLFIIIYLLILWALITVSYSETPTYGYALQGVGIYAKLLFLLVLPVAIQSEKMPHWIEQGLILGVLVNVILSVLYRFGVPLGIYELTSHFINPIQVAFVEVLGIWLLATRFKKRWNWTDAFIFIILVVHLWAFNVERCGYLLFISLTFLFAWQYSSRKVFAYVCGLILIGLVGVYAGVHTVRERVDAGIQDITLFYTQGVSETSLGARLAMTRATYETVKEHPILGTGVRSFRFVYAKKFNNNIETFTEPHNVYSHVAFELGLPGLILYLLFLYQLLRCIGQAPISARRLMQGVWLAFVVMGFTESSIALNAVMLSTMTLLSIHLREPRKIAVT